MLKSIFSFVVLTLMAFLFSCAPQGNGNGVGRPKTDDQVSEEAVNLLTANKWCQLNTATGATEYIWAFDKNFKVTSTQTSNQETESFVWAINSNNIFSVALAPQVAALFTKQVFYSYDVNNHKRTMFWKDPANKDLINFTECE